MIDTAHDWSKPPHTRCTRCGAYRHLSSGYRPCPGSAAAAEPPRPCAGSGIIAAERIEHGDSIIIAADGRAYLADRTEAVRRAAVERAIARHMPEDDYEPHAPPAAAADTSADAPPADPDDGADTAIITRAR